MDDGGFVAPSSKRLLLTSNGLLAKYGMWQARRQGTAARLAQLASEIRPAPPRSPGRNR